MFTSNATDVILHAFDWPYSLVTQRAEQIARAGYKHVLISPPMKSFKSAQGTQWWQRYQPQDYRVIDNQLGNTTDVREMVAELKKYGVGVYADVVFNHMANESSIRSDLYYPSFKDLKAYAEKDDYFLQQKLFGDLSKPLFYHNHFVEAFGIEDWQDQWQVQNGRITGGASDPGLPTLRVCDYVIEQQRNYLFALKSIGIKGFRIDAAKHMSIEHLKRVWTDDICEGVHIFGEIITNGGVSKPEYELFLEPFLANTKFGAYDFPLFQMTYDALAENGSLKELVDPYCFGQALSENRAVIFAITHDIPNNDVFADLVMDEELEWLAYTYVLGRDGGVPLIYTDLDTCGLTDKHGQARWLNAWNEPKMVKAIGFHNKMHAKPMNILEASDDLLAFSRGDEGIVIINKSKRSQTFEVKTTHNWKDVLTGKVHVGEAEILKMNIAPVSSMMLIAVK